MGFICEWDNGDTPINTPTPIITIQPTPTLAPTNTPTPKVTQEPTVTPKVTTTPQPTKAPSYKKSKLSSKKETIYVGDTVQLKLLSANGDVKWSTSNKKIATVKNGLVTGKKKGKTTITATDTVTGKKYKCKVTVKSKETSSESDDTIKKTLKKIGEYIKKNGEYDSKNDCYAIYNNDFGYSLKGYFYLWRYYPKDKVVEFGFYLLEDDKIKYPGMVTFKYETDNPSKCFYTILFTNNGEPAIYADDYYYIAKFNNNIDFDSIEVYSDGRLVNSFMNEKNKKVIIDYISTSIEILRSGTEEILFNDLKLTFKDLGYNKWIID